MRSCNRQGLGTCFLASTDNGRNDYCTTVRLSNSPVVNPAFGIASGGQCLKRLSIWETKTAEHPGEGRSMAVGINHRQLEVLCRCGGHDKIAWRRRKVLNDVARLNVFHRPTFELNTLREFAEDCQSGPLRGMTCALRCELLRPIAYNDAARNCAFDAACQCNGGLVLIA